MGKKILTRLAAGTCGICFCYALAYQAISGDVTSLEPEYAITEPATEPVTETPAEGAIPESPVVDNNTTHRHGKRRRWEDNDVGAIHESPVEETAPEQDNTTEETEEEDEKQSDRGEQEDGTEGGNTTASDDPPTLSEFLSTLRCGGCRHGCSLLNPRCMKGRSKAERATVEYQETYGSDNT